MVAPLLCDVTVADDVALNAAATGAFPPMLLTVVVLQTTCIYCSATSHCRYSFYTVTNLFCNKDNTPYNNGLVLLMELFLHLNSKYRRIENKVFAFYIQLSTIHDLFRIKINSKTPAKRNIQSPTENIGFTFPRFLQHWPNIVIDQSDASLYYWITCDQASESRALASIIVCFGNVFCFIGGKLTA